MGNNKRCDFGLTDILEGLGGGSLLL